MYESFYGLSELPFELTANPKFLYLSAGQREALSTLEYGLFSAKAITLLVGEAGTGKTTLIQAALESPRCRDVRCIYLNNPTLRADDFVRLLAHKLDMSPEVGESKALLLAQLETLLRERRAGGVITALVVDEAQSLSFEILEEIRFLANIETPAVKLLPVVLSGQPELAPRLEENNLRQLKQRVALRALLQPFELAETAAYISSRIVTAGGVPGRMFSLEAVTLIHELSGGIARTISVICDNALVTGMALGRHPIDRATVAEVCRELQFAPGRHRAVAEAQPSLANTDRVAIVDRAESLHKPDESAEGGRPRPMATLVRSRAGRTITE